VLEHLLTVTCMCVYSQ